MNYVMSKFGITDKSNLFKYNKVMCKKHVAAILVIFANLCVGSAQIVPQYSIQTVDWEPAVFKGVPYQPVEQKTQVYRTNSSSTRNKSVEVGDSWTVSEIFKKRKLPLMQRQ